MHKSPTLYYYFYNMIIVIVIKKMPLNENFVNEKNFFESNYNQRILTKICF